VSSVKVSGEARGSQGSEVPRLLADVLLHILRHSTFRWTRFSREPEKCPVSEQFSSLRSGHDDAISVRLREDAKTVVNVVI